MKTKERGHIRQVTSTAINSHLEIELRDLFASFLNDFSCTAEQPAGSSPLAAFGGGVWFRGTNSVCLWQLPSPALCILLVAFRRGNVRTLTQESRKSVMVLKTCSPWHTRCYMLSRYKFVVDVLPSKFETPAPRPCPAPPLSQQGL